MRIDSLPNLVRTMRPVEKWSATFNRGENE